MQRSFELRHLDDGQHTIYSSGIAMEGFVFDGSSRAAASLLEVLIRLGGTPNTLVSHSDLRVQWRASAKDAQRSASAINGIFNAKKPNIISKLRDLNFIREHIHGRNKSYELAPDIVWRYECHRKGCPSHSATKEDTLSDLLNAIEFSHFGDAIKFDGTPTIAFPLCLRAALMALIAMDFDRYEKIKKYQPYLDGLKKIDTEFPTERNYYQIILAWEKYDAEFVEEAEATLDAIYRSGITSMGSLLQASYHLLKAYILRKKMLSTDSKAQGAALLNLALIEAKQAYSHSLLVDNLVLIMESIWVVANLLMYFKMKCVDFKGDLTKQLKQFRDLEGNFWRKFGDRLPSTYTPLRAANMALYASKIDQQYGIALQHLGVVFTPQNYAAYVRKYDLTRCYVEGFRASLELDLSSGVFAKSKAQLSDVSRHGLPSTKEFYAKALKAAQHGRRSGKPHQVATDQKNAIEVLLKKYLAASIKRLGEA
jgi:hypothetical protein